MAPSLTQGKPMSTDDSLFIYGSYNLICSRYLQEFIHILNAFIILKILMNYMYHMLLVQMQPREMTANDI